MASLTVYAETNDFGIESADASWTTARAGAGLFIPGGASFAAIQIGTESGASWQLRQALWEWDSSPLGSGATVSAAALSLYLDIDQSDRDPEFRIRVYDWGGGTGTTADYVAGADLSALTRVATKTSATGGGYNAFTSDAAFVSNINKTGYTRLLGHLAEHESATAPSTTRANVHWRSADNAGTTSDPKLEITYTPPPATASGISANYGSYTRTGPSNTPWALNFTGAGGIDAYQVRTAAAGGGSLVASGAASVGSNSPTIAYNATGLVQGDQTLYLRVSSDGGSTFDNEYSFTLKRDDSAATPTNLAQNPDPVPPTRQYAINFDGPDTYSTATNEMLWQIRTASGGGGTLIGSGSFTQGTGKSTSAVTDTLLVDGPNTRYLRIRDGANNYAEQSLSVQAALLVADLGPEEMLPHTLIARRRQRQRGRYELIHEAIANAEFLPFSSPAVSPALWWAVGGLALVTPEIRWALGGRVSQERTIQWRVAPSALRVHYALTGRTGPVVYAFRFEKRSKTNQFIADVSAAVLAAQVDLNNDRTVLRTARFTIDPSAEGVSIDPLADHIAVIMELLVDGSYELDIPMGLFALNVPAKEYRPQADETWEVEANDLTMHLLEATTTTAYRVASGANYITGANAVKAIFDSFGLAHAFPATTRTLPVDLTWPPGTPWATVANELLHGAGMYSHWFDASGVGRSQLLDDLSRRAADVEYSGDDFVLIPIREEAETTRLANQVIVVVDDPNRAPLSSVATNDDPDSPVSTVTLGRTITKVIQADAAADQATLDERAQRELQEAASLYRRATLLTSIDPRREGREVYELTVEGVYEAEKWWVRNWAVELKPAAQMRHTLGRVERVVTS